MRRALLFAFLTGMTMCVPACATVPGEIETRRVRGEWTLSPESDASPKEAFFRAQNEARRKAILAVCGERVSSWDTLLSQKEGQTYSGVIVTNSVGVVHAFKELRRGWTFPRAGETAAHESPTVFVEAEVSVKKSSEEPDPAFTALISGGKSVYENGEEDTFSVKVAQDAYLTVFWLNQDFRADIVFPEHRWESNLIRAEKKVPEFSLVFEISSPRATRETGTLFFVLTKQPYPFLKNDKNRDPEQNRERLERWMANIPLRERFIYAVPFVITKN
ncbi:MAG: DUF4384 domain-containing protein [Opitutales bacterium]|nr:DUF4384 domain-containing protein [Opitutales bacterium]